MGRDFSEDGEISKDSMQITSDTIYNLSQLWSEAVVKFLVSRDVSFYISPGMRSIPLIRAIYKYSSVKCVHVIIDERAAGFMALGGIKSSKLPAVLVCTSGSALSNYFPSIIEAKQSGYPLIVLSADRPSELIAAGANQTINQHGIFGEYVTETLNLDDSSSAISLANVVAQLSQVIDLAIKQKTTAHINLPLSEPLTLIKDTVSQMVITEFQSIVINKIDLFQEDQDFKIDEIKKILLRSKKPFVFIGEINKLESISSLKKWVTDAKIPICVDILSSLKFSNPRFLQSFDNEGVREQILSYSPDLIIFLGGRSVSKQAAVFLKSLECDKLVLDSMIAKHHRFITQNCYVVNIEKLASILEPLSKLHLKMDCFTLESSKNNDGLFTYKQIAELTTYNIPDNSNLILSNSLAIRVFEKLQLALIKNISIYSTRGTSGIEGEIAHAAGIAANSNNEAKNILIVGDISFLYDINSLTILKNITNLIIVVVNNQGGRIFESLFEKDTSDKQVLEAITSQHNFDIESIVKSFDIQCKTVTDSFSFQQTLLNALKHNDVEIIHCLITSKDIQ